MGWLGTENGELLQQAAAYEFDALVTTDAKIEKEQDLDNLPLTVVLLKAGRNRFADLQPLIREVLPALKETPRSSFLKIRGEERERTNEQEPNFF